MPSRLPSGVLSRVHSEVVVKLGRRGGTLEGMRGGRPNLVSAGNRCPDHPLLPGDCGSDGAAWLRPDPAPPTTWVVGSVLNQVVSGEKRRRGWSGKGFLRMEI